MNVRSYSALLCASALVLLSNVGWAAQASGAKQKLSTQCVSAGAYKSLMECPGGPSKFDIRKKRSAAFSTAPPARSKKKKSSAAPPPPDASQSAGFRDSRKGRLKQRARKLLITEISGLERLYKRTKKRSPDKAQLTRRLAEGYVELASAGDRDRIKAQIQADDAKRKKKRKVYNSAMKTVASSKRIVKTARKNAIKYYKKMKRHFPNYSKLDEVLYYLAYEYEQLGKLDSARKVYFELIEKSPKSKYVPNAYLAFGELFFQDAMADPSKWVVAANAYRQVTKYKPPENLSYGYARYKLAYVYWNSGKLQQAIQEFKNVIEYGDSFENLPNAKQLRKTARRDLVPVYAAKGRPERAYNFFKPLSGDKGGENTKTLGMLYELGLAYIDTGFYGEGITLFNDLMSRDKGDKYCEYQTHVSHAIQALKANDKAAIKKVLDKQVLVMKQFASAKHSSASKLACANKTAEVLAETGMSWHLEAVGSGGTRGTGDKRTMDLAAYLYKKIVENFSTKDFARFKFPRIMKADWPNIYKIKYAMADLLYVQERWEDCGPAFDSVVAENPTGAEAPEAAYASVLCYQKMYDQMHKGGSDRKSGGHGPTGASKKDKESKTGQWEKIKPKPFDEMQKGMLTAFNRYICYILPPKGNKEAEEQYVEVKYARARTYFEAQHWEEAAVAFRDIAINHSDQEASLFAAQLYLESLNVLGAKAEPPRPTCFDDMAGDVPVFLKLFCEGSKFEDNKEQCELLTRIQCDIKRLSAEKTVELARTKPEGSAEALALFKKGGDRYVELWRTYGEKQLSAGEESQCGAMDEILHNGAQAYQAARLLAKSIGVRRLLLNPSYGLHETDLANQAIYLIGGNYQAIAVYDQAAKYYMRYAEKTKYKGEHASQALSDAVVLNLGLGHEDEAIAAAKAFNRNFGRKEPAKAAQIAFAVAANYAEKEHWKKARTQLAGGISLIDRKATLDVRIQAHALFGHVLTKLKTRADGEYRKTLALWKDPAKAVAAINEIPEDAASRQRRLGRALTAVGEAYYHFAEKEYKKAMGVKFPVYKGAGTRDAVMKHIQTKVKKWINKKKPLIDTAGMEFKKIVDLKPVPPPQWVIAAGSRVGEMWGTFVKEFRAAPIPAYMKKDPVLRTAYYGALDDASEPLKRRAKAAYRTCLGYSVTYQYFDHFSRSCEKWLSEEYKNEFHLIDEFSGAPNRVNSVLQERAQPLRLGGAPVVTAAKASKAPAKKEEK
ncbi:MAG: hypothetical protein HRU17_20065 [Polyangiaceae bacterium]|nr:hypothetical protein [Polyangiaceae bacterium]